MVTTAQAAISKGENGDSLTERDNMRGAKGVPDYRTVVMGFPTAEWLFEHQGSESNGTYLRTLDSKFDRKLVTSANLKVVAPAKAGVKFCLGCDASKIGPRPSPGRQ